MTRKRLKTIDIDVNLHNKKDKLRSGTIADFQTTADILAEAGIPFFGQVVPSAGQALEAAEQLGYPLVMKILSPEITHKSDVGGVLLNLWNPGLVAQGFETLVRRAQEQGTRKILGVLLQKQADPGLELMVGARHDPTFGPWTTVGLGGRLVELLRDVSSGIGVLTEEDGDRLLTGALAGRVFEGYRNMALDRRAVIDVVVKVSRLMSQRPEIHEMDLNPVIVYPQGIAIVDARLLIGQPVSSARAEPLSQRRLNSLNAIFEARSVAIVGASQQGTVGGILLKNASGMEKIYPINPKRDQVLGRKCYHGFEELPEMPTLAVFGVSPEATLKGFKEFCVRGGQGAVIISDGFAESGRAELELGLKEISQEYGVVYIGPNGLGVVNNFTGLNTMFLPEIRCALGTTPGPIGIISQSGGIGLELLEMAAGELLHVGKCISMGNASGVTVPELLASLGADPKIKVIAAYLEGVRDGLQFIEVAKRVADQKPIIVIKGGMGGGAEATKTHTASLAGSFEVFKAACNHAGIYLLEDLTEDPRLLINVLSLLISQPRPHGDRIGVVSVGGGAGILLADQITAQGMHLATFDEETQASLTRLLEHKITGPDETHRLKFARGISTNPIDLFGDADDDRLEQAIRLLDADPNVDVILVGLYFQIPLLSEFVAERLVDLHKVLHKPLIISPRGHSAFVRRKEQYLKNRGVPTYKVPLIPSLAVALKIWQRYEQNFLQ